MVVRDAIFEVVVRMVFLVVVMRMGLIGVGAYGLLWWWCVWAFFVVVVVMRMVFLVVVVVRVG